MSKVKRQFEHEKDRERDKAEKKQHEKETEIQEKKGYGAPKPFWLIVIGVPIVLFIVYLWIVYAGPRAG